MDQRTAFEKVKNYISFLKRNNFSIQKAYVFGSYANGTYHENSDIDLALVMKNLSNGYLMQVELMKISRKFDTRIEPHPFDEADFNTLHPFADEILKTGIEIT